MYDVYIRFIDGTAIRLRARQFDINVGRVSQEGKPKPKQFLYRDANGRETPIYLRLDQVVAIIVTPVGEVTPRRPATKAASGAGIRGGANGNGGTVTHGVRGPSDTGRSGRRPAHPWGDPGPL